MSGQRKSIGVKFTEQQNLAIEKWMTETSCSRQVAIIGLLVKGAKEMGVWDDDPRAGASRFARNHNHNGICTTYGEGTSSTRSGSSTSEEKLKSENIPSENTSSKEDYAFEEFWHSIPKVTRRGTKEESKRKWFSKKVLKELDKSGLTPTDVASRYVAYFKGSKGEGFAGRRYVKHVCNWLDAFGFHDEVATPEDTINKSHYDMDLT